MILIVRALKGSAVALAAVAVLSCGPTPAAAQIPTPPPRPLGEIPYLNFPPDAPTAIPPVTAAPAPADKEPPGLDALKRRDQELDTVRTEQRKALEAEARLKREIEAIGDDRRKLNQQLIETATRVRTVEEQIAATEERLKPLDDKEAGLRESLEGRREVVAEVLAAMQRIGRHPPPAIMVKAEDALQSVRSAMLLGAVLPDMRRDMQTIAGALTELAGVRKQIADERDRLARDRNAIADDRQRLTMLVDQRQKQQTETEKALAAERQRAASLGRQASDLKDLIGKLEQGLDPATLAARQASRADDVRVPGSRPDLAALNDPGRLVPAIAFASAKGLLPLPINGVRLKDFGASDGLGGTEKGLSIAARAGAQITAPCDGWVVYAGPFRNYGQLLILNAGGGYHVLLAGMERISVDLGQFVVTGEPVAIMGGGAKTVAAIATGSGQPVLYVEFRKDGVPVDPGPWWAKSEGEKVRG